jgi:hypothetical protein
MIVHTNAPGVSDLLMDSRVLMVPGLGSPLLSLSLDWRESGS